MYVNDAIASSISTITRVKGAFGNDASRSMNASPGERGSAQIYDVAGRPSSSADNGGKGRPNAVEKGPTSGYKRKKAAERLDSVDTGSLPVKRRKSSSEGSCEKTGTVKQKIQVNGAEKCQTMDHYGNRTVVIENNGHESETDGVEFEVVRDGSRSVTVMNKKTSDVDSDKAVISKVKIWVQEHVPNVRVATLGLSTLNPTPTKLWLPLSRVGGELSVL